MKKNIKWIFIGMILTISLADIIGIWKYKLSGTKYVEYVSSDSISEGEENQSSSQILFDDSNIEYKELTNRDFWADEKLFIIDIEEAPGQNKYNIKGLIYEEYSITIQEYNSLKNGSGSIDIFGITYTKDKIKSSSLMLKSENSEAESFYIKYNATTKKYIVKDSTTDYSVYKPSGRYLKTTVDASLPFTIQRNNKSEKLTVAEVAKMHTKVEPPKDKVKINFSTLEFNKKGEITKITELSL